MCVCAATECGRVARACAARASGPQSASRAAIAARKLDWMPESAAGPPAPRQFRSRCLRLEAILSGSAAKGWPTTLPRAV
eukprot:485911-Prymnesium_polylepis.1